MGCCCDCSPASNNLSAASFPFAVQELRKLLDDATSSIAIRRRFPDLGVLCSSGVPVRPDTPALRSGVATDASDAASGVSDFVVLALEENCATERRRRFLAFVVDDIAWDRKASEKGAKSGPTRNLWVF